MLGLGNSVSSLSYISGKYNNFSGSFDGTADFVLTPEEDEIAKITDVISISVWVKPNLWNMTNGSNNDAFIGCYNSGGWMLYLSNTGTNTTKIKFIIHTSDSGSGSAGTISANVNKATTEALSGWQNIVATYDGTTAKIFVSGSTSGVTNATSASGASIAYHASNSRPVVLGADASGDTTGQDFYHGLLDQVAIWNAVLDSDAITAIYNSGVPFDLTADEGNYDNSGDLVGYWRFEEGAGTSVADSSTNSNNGGLGNAWSWSTDVPE